MWSKYEMRRCVYGRSCRYPKLSSASTHISVHVAFFQSSSLNLHKNMAAFTAAGQTVMFVRQMKNQLDATLCRFYFCTVTLHVSGARAHHQEYLKLQRRPLLHVLSLQVSHHISLFGPNKEMWWLTCNDNTCTSGRCTSFKYSWWWALDARNM